MYLGPLQLVVGLGTLQLAVDLGTLQLVVVLGMLQLVVDLESLVDFGMLQVGLPVRLGAKCCCTCGNTASEAVLLSQKTSAYHVSQPYVEGGSSPPIWGRVDFQGLWPCSIFPDFSGENGLRSPHV